MKVLVTIPHYFHPSEDGRPARHGSAAASQRAARAAALERVIVGLHDLFGDGRHAALHDHRRLRPAKNPFGLDLTVAVFTTRGRHLLDGLDHLSDLYEHHATDADPPFLGWECHAHLRDAQPGYDYYCYIEDDILILDPMFFAKLDFFNASLRRQGRITEILLQPQRYESDLTGAVAGGGFRGRVYIDYQAAPPPPPSEPITINCLGRAFQLERSSLPHAGCFFLAAEQMEHLAARPWFLDRETIWVSPLDTAATLAIARTFKVYKPALDSLAFFEVCHAHPHMLQEIREMSAEGPVWDPDSLGHHRDL